MSLLAERQSEFQNFLTGGDARIVDRVRSTNKAAAELLIGVYAEGYWLRLVEVLGANFPKLAAFLGPERFAELARAYIAAEPSRHPNARWFGHRLPGFLRAAPDRGGDPALADLAAFEWSLGLAFDAPDATAIAATAMGALPPEQWALARFSFHPSLATLAIASDAVSVWQAIEEGRPPERGDMAVVPATWAIWRREDLLTYFRSLDPGEPGALDLARDGASFGELCEHCAATAGAEAAAGVAAQFLAQWFADGIVTAIRTDQ